MISLRESLEQLMDASADQLLTDGDSPEGQQALARLALLIALVERLDGSEQPWDDCDFIPASLPLLTGPMIPTVAGLPH